MTDREIIQLIGHLNPCTFAELYDYYAEYPQAAIKKRVKRLESKRYITFTAYEKTGWYLAPEGMKAYQYEKNLQA